MSIWPPTKGDLARPAYRSLARALSEAISSGRFRPGDRLPPHRELAFELGVSVQTVSRAYEELARLGLLTGEVGRGSFVRTETLQEARVPWHRLARSEAVIDCSMLAPVTGDLHAHRFAAALVSLAEAPPPEVMFSFRPRATLEAHCDAVRPWLRRLGVDVSRDRILPTNGSTAAMSVALMTAAAPGDLILTEEMGHHTLKPLTASLGLRVQGLEMDAEGIRPEAFESACAAGPVAALFVMPNGLGATGARMGEDRRREIAEIARRNNVWIIENDAWGPLAEERCEPIASIAPERTFHITGLSKCLLPGLRVGWLTSPDKMVSAARTRHLVTHWMATPLLAEIAARWIADGTAVELLAWQRAALERRNSIAAHAFTGLPHVLHRHGLHVWLPLPDAWDEDDFVAHARHEGVAVAAGARFAIGAPQRHQGVRVCLGSGSESELAEGLAVLGRLARSEPEPALLAL